ncbi:MAG TPA: hypothetical protein VMN57_03335 [Anaerolineales bacterium]|nr:hypothetical protein [Anaerolineales bacterium]
MSERRSAFRFAALLLAITTACSAPSPSPGGTEPPGGLTGSPTERSGTAAVPVPSTSTAAPIPVATATPYPGSIHEPFSIGSEAEWISPDGLTLGIKITEAYRGWAARQIVLAGGEPAATTPAGFEWFYFRAELSYSGPDRGPVDLDPGFWSLVSTGTTTTWDDAPVCCLDPSFDFTLAHGETRAGVLALLVPVEEPAPLVGAGGEAGIHFAASYDSLTPTNVLFEDDFSVADSGWQDLFRDGTGVSDYDQGGFRLQVLERNYDYWANPGLEYADVRIEVEAAKIGGPDDNAFGLICRYTDAANFYFFLVASDGYFAIGKYTAGDYDLIGSDLMVPSDVVIGGEATNRLRAECIGETLRLFVNGVQLAEVTDPDHTAGDVGLIASTFDEPGTDILFDHFAVLSP